MGSPPLELFVRGTLGLVEERENTPISNRKNTSLLSKRIQRDGNPVVPISRRKIGSPLLYRTPKDAHSSQHKNTAKDPRSHPRKETVSYLL